MSVDLKGNTNYVIFKNEHDDYVVPRTALSAIDMVAGNDIIVENDTLRVREATVEDVVNGTTASGVITANVLKEAIDEGYIVPDTATVEEIIEGTGDDMVTPVALTGALTAGKATDLTKAPSVSTGTLVPGIHVKDLMRWTGTGSGTIGFYAGAEFGGFVAGRRYMILADITNTGSTDVTVGTGADIVLNESLPVSIAAGETARVAALFLTNDTGYFTVTADGAFSLALKMREYATFGCSDEAIDYIAQLVDVDDTNSYYLVDQESVNPWQNMINMGSAQFATIQAGGAYKLVANDGNTHTLAVPTIKANTYGRPAYIELFVGSGAAISLQPPLRFAHGNSFTDNTLNNCSVRFMDGIATLTVDSTESSFIVSLAGGTYTTEDGTIYYGINGSTATLIIFNSSTDGLDADMNGAAANDDKTIIGNGVDRTTLTGSGSFGNYVTSFDAVNFKDATLSGTALGWSNSIGVTGQLTNNGAVTTTANTTVTLLGASTSNAAISGSGGSITLGNNTTIDASQNETGAVLISQSIATGSSVAVIGAGGVRYSVNSGTGSNLLSNGLLCNDLYTVTVASGTSAGTLYSVLTNNISDGIVFSHTLDGQTVSIPDGTTISTDANVVGNGADKTTISGTYTVPSGKTMNLQDLAVSGGTLSQVDTGKYYLYNVTLNNVALDIPTTWRLSGSTIIIPQGSTVTAPGTLVSLCNVNNLILNGKLENVRLLETSVTGDGSGVLDGGNKIGVLISLTTSTNTEVTVSNITITGGSAASNGGGGWLATGKRVTYNNVIFTGNYASAGSRDCYIDNISDYVAFNNCVFATPPSISVSKNAPDIYLSGCTFGSAVSGTWVVSLNSKNPGKARTTLTISNTLKINDTIYSYYGYDVVLTSGTTLDLSENVRGALMGYAVGSTPLVGHNYITIGDNVSILTRNNTTAVVDACSCMNISTTAALSSDNGITITGSTVDPWKATNVIFASPLDASAASTVKLSGTTFTSASLISPAPMRIQLPASTTVSTSGNTNSSDTKILQAPIIVVGDDAAAPAGSATVVNSAGSAATVSGIGTYVANNGDNDFVDISSITTVSTANGLGTGLAGANRWVKLTDNLVTSMTGSADVVDKRIITPDYEPILGGTYTISSGGTMTVDEATKTATVAGGTMKLIDADMAKGVKVAVGSGGRLAVEKVTGNGGVINLGGTEIANPTSLSMVASGCVFENGIAPNGGVLITAGTTTSARFVDCHFTNNSATAYAGGALFTNNGTFILSGCSIYGNHAHDSGGAIFASGGISAYGCYIRENTVRIASSANDIFMTSGSAYMSGCVIGDFKADANVFVTFDGETRIDSVYGDCSAVFSSGAILDLTGSTNSTPVNPGGGVTISGGATIVYGEFGSASSGTIDLNGANKTFKAIASGGVLVTNDTQYFNMPNGGTLTSMGLNTGSRYVVVTDYACGFTLDSVRVFKNATSGSILYISCQTQTGAVVTLKGRIELADYVIDRDSVSTTGNIKIESGCTLTTSKTGLNYIVRLGAGVVDAPNGLTVIDGNENSHSITGGTYSIIYANGTTA